MRWEAGCGDTIKPRLAVHTLQIQSADRGIIELIVGEGEVITPPREGLEQNNLVVECGPYLLSMACFNGKARECGGKRIVISKLGKKADSHAARGAIAIITLLVPSEVARAYDVGQKRAPPQKDRRASHTHDREG